MVICALSTRALSLRICTRTGLTLSYAMDPPPFSPPPPPPPGPPPPPPGLPPPVFSPPGPPAAAYSTQAAASYGVDLATYPPPAPVNPEISTVPEAVRVLLQIGARVVLGLGILGLLSGGLCFVSSILVIAQGALWLTVTSSALTLATEVGLLKTYEGTRCCSTTFSNLNALAIAAIVFAALEVVVSMVVGFWFGWFTILESFLPEAGWNCDGCNITPDDVVTAARRLMGTGTWLVYAAGSSLVTGGLNIAHSVLTLFLLRFLTRVIAPFAAGSLGAPVVALNPLAAAGGASGSPPMAWAQETLKSV